MAIVEPLPAGVHGKADWKDYSNYWREADAEWMQERLILRYASPATRQTDWPAPKFGHVTYNETSDRLETYSKVQNGWSTVQQYVNLTSTQDTTGGVAISHKNAGSKGIIFEPTRTQLDNPIWVMGGVLGVDATGVTVKTGTKTVKLTTDATSLVSDSPISGTALTLTGTLTGVNVTLSGVLTAPNITMTGTITGGVLNGTSGTIGSVAIATAGVGGAGIVNASAGLQSQTGMFYGDGTYAYVQQRAANKGTLGTAFLRVSATASEFTGDVSMNNYLRIKGGLGVPWYKADGTTPGNIAPIIYSVSDPGAANFPDGTLWLS